MPTHIVSPSISLPPVIVNNIIIIIIIIIIMTTQPPPLPPRHRPGCAHATIHAFHTSA